MARRNANAEKFKDFAVFCAKTSLRPKRCSSILEVGTSTLSRWQAQDAHITLVKDMSGHSEKEVFNIKIKYAIRLLFKRASLIEIKRLSTSFETRTLPDDSDSYKRIVDAAEIVDLDIFELLNELADRAERVAAAATT